jgi:hypothetical protein
LLLKIIIPTLGLFSLVQLHGLLKIITIIIIIIIR